MTFCFSRLLTLLQGHEFTGTVEEIGSDVKNFKKGDQVVSPFTVSWSVRHSSRKGEQPLIV
jgi:threonine dehydrogenase-like Zn-dependent dehydrogenase